MKKVIKKVAYEVKEFLKLFMLGYIPCMVFMSLFFTLKGLMLLTVWAATGFLILCIICYILQTRKEKKMAAKAKIRRSEI